MGRKRHYTKYLRSETPTRPSYPNYDQLFESSLLPQPPQVNYIPFDRDVVLDDTKADFVELETLRETLVYSTKRDPRVSFTTYAQEYPEIPATSYPAPPNKPAITVILEPQLPIPPELRDFLPARSGLSARIPLLYAVQCAIFGPRAKRKLDVGLPAHNKAYKAAEEELIQVRMHNVQAKMQLQEFESARNKWETLNDRYHNLNAQTGLAWEKMKQQFVALKVEDIARLGQFKKAYFERSPDDIVLHSKLALVRSPYPAVFPRSVEAAYDPDTQILVIDYQLPDIESISIVKPSTKKDVWQSFVPVNATERRQVSDDLLYMIMLRTLREVVLVDEISAFSAVVVNGWMSFKDKATGQQRSEYLMSLFAKSEQVRAIDFANVDPKTCFRSLKGVSAPRPSQCVPIAPLLNFDKDRRIITSRQVIDNLATETNLAVMPWDDFEHLIRELFEKEFAHNGAEVRVTQASHDRGVDALVFDPDPVRGGKYVIQAKRYTITVDVSSVRDLYGTVVNEGANRGILVTTSAYGPDAYDFAKDKPITLIDGSRLLHLLQRHGYNFRIDLKEARRLLFDQRGADAQ